MRIAILDDYQACAERMADWSSIKSCAEVKFFTEPFRSSEELISALNRFDVLCLMRERTAFPRDVLSRLRSLKHIVLTGRRSSTLDIHALGDFGITIDYTGVGPAMHATPELTIALMMSLARNIPTGDRAMREGRWLGGAPLGRVLFGRTLGIIGLGNVGSRVAGIANAIGMRVIAWSPNLTAERAQAAQVEFAASKAALLAESDVVSLHLVLADSTRDIISAADFEIMKETAFLINTARGQLVSEPALLDALEHKRIAGAAMDVYCVEPLPEDHPLRVLENCILLPHFGYVTEEIYRTFYGETVQALARYLDAGASV